MVKDLAECPPTSQATVAGLIGVLYVSAADPSKAWEDQGDETSDIMARVAAWRERRIESEGHTGFPVAVARLGAPETANRAGRASITSLCGAPVWLANNIDHADGLDGRVGVAPHAEDAKAEGETKESGSCRGTDYGDGRGVDVLTDDDDEGGDIAAYGGIDGEVGLLPGLGSVGGVPDAERLFVNFARQCVRETEASGVGREATAVRGRGHAHSFASGRRVYLSETERVQPAAVTAGGGGGGGGSDACTVM